MEVTGTSHYYAQSYSRHQVVEHELTKIRCRLVKLCVRQLCHYYEERESLAGDLQAGACRSADAREVWALAFDLKARWSLVLIY